MLSIELKWPSCSQTHRPTHGQGTLYSIWPSCSLTQRPTHGQGTLYSIWPSCSLTYKPTRGQGILYFIYKIVSLLSPAWLHARLDQMFADGCCNSSFKMALIITRHTWPVGFKQDFCISFSTSVKYQIKTAFFAKEHWELWEIFARRCSCILWHQLSTGVTVQNEQSPVLLLRQFLKVSAQRWLFHYSLCAFWNVELFTFMVSCFWKKAFCCYMIFGNDIRRYFNCWISLKN